MQIPTIPELSEQTPTDRMLLELGFPAHKIGYDALCIGIPRFALDKRQSLSKDLYPYIAEKLDIAEWRSVENDIRRIISEAWENRNPAIWDKYFPGLKRAPTNKRFIATLAKYL